MSDRAVPGTGGPWLQPILVDYAGRDGSTLMMRLLATSPEIAVGPEYPYEEKYFTYLWFWSRILDRRDFPPGRWHHGHLGSLALESSVPLVGPPTWRTLRLFDAEATGESFSTRAFDLLWEEFSRRAADATHALHGGATDRVRFYAEKNLMTWRTNLATLPPVRVLALLRDPRDVWTSIRVVNERRAGTEEPLIGRDPSETEDAWLLRFLNDQRERLRWLLELSDSETPVFRYESLVTDLAGQAERLESWLEVRLNPEEVIAEEGLRGRHATSTSAAASIGRWRTDAPPEHAQRITAALAAELAALGYS